MTRSGTESIPVTDRLSASREVLVRATLSRPRSTGGAKNTGLGLSILQEPDRAPRRHDPQESELGRGSRFFFTLPVF